MIDDLINEFCTYLLIDKNYSNNTIESYRNDLELFNRVVNKNISSINDSDIKEIAKNILNSFIEEDDKNLIKAIKFFIRTYEHYQGLNLRKKFRNFRKNGSKSFN